MYNVLKGDFETIFKVIVLLRFTMRNHKYDIIENQQFVVSGFVSDGQANYCNSRFDKSLILFKLS